MIIQTTRLVGVALGLWLVGTTWAQAGSLYKWVGEDGSVHYSAQSPVMTKSQTLQRIRLHAHATREILAPDFDSRRNIVAAEANAMMSQDEESPALVHVSADTSSVKRKSVHTATAANLQTRTADDTSSGAPLDGAQKTVVDTQTDYVKVQ